MQTIQMNGVTVHNVPLTEGLMSVEVAEGVSRLTALAGLYGLHEVGYEHLFLTTLPTEFSDACPHCQGTKEIAILQTATNENVFVPCVCNEEYVAPIASDIGGVGTNASTATNEIVATVAVPAEGTPNAQQVEAHMGNQVALLRSFGYDFTAVNGQPCRYYQFMVIGEDASDDQADELTKILSVLHQDATVYPLQLTGVVNALEEFETPRILTPTEIAMKRLRKDLLQVENVQAIIDIVERDFARNQLLEAQDIALNPQDFTTTEFMLQTFVRMVITMAKQQNARYDVINPENGTRIANAYYYHEATNTHYLATEYFMSGSPIPTNYTLAKESPTEGQRVVTTTGFQNTVTNLLTDVTTALI